MTEHERSPTRPKVSRLLTCQQQCILLEQIMNLSSRTGSPSEVQICSADAMWGPLEKWSPNCPMLACQQIFGRPSASVRPSRSAPPRLQARFCLICTFPILLLLLLHHPFRKQFRSLISLVFLSEVSPTPGRLRPRPTELWWQAEGVITLCRRSFTSKQNLNTDRMKKLQ